MKYIWYAFIVIVFALSWAIILHAQTAKVEQLSPQEAKQAKALHDEQDAIAKKIADFDQAIRIKYLTAGKDEEGHTQTYSLNGSWIWVKSGWGSGGFLYSEDFRFIVPFPYTPSSNNCSSMLCGVTLTPAFLTN